jgi:hypothetical protein
MRRQVRDCAFTIMAITGVWSLCCAPTALWAGTVTSAERLAAYSAPPDHIGPHSRTWRHPDNGLPLVEIATGMNYWDGKQWSPSDPSFVPEGDGFIAGKIQHKTRLSSEINVQGAIAVATPNGPTLYSTPVGVGLYDAASGQFALIGELTNSTGVLISSNQVLYENAFDGVCASLVYSVERGTFAQDVVFTGRLNPSDYGFPTNTTQIQIITELYDPPTPEVLVHPLFVETKAAVRSRMVSPDIMDQTIGYGEFVLGSGRAYTIPTEAATNGTAATVFKSLVTTEGRTFLVESVTYESIRRGMESLPPCSPLNGGQAKYKKSSLNPKTIYASIPAKRSTHQADTSPAHNGQKRARAAKSPAGLVIDYIATIGGSLSGTIVFQSSTNYFVSGAVFCNGPTTIEGGTVFKYKVGASLTLNSTLTCKGSMYRPIICTGVDDDTVGDTLNGWPNSGYTGVINTNGYAHPAISSQTSLTLRNFRFCYAQIAIGNGNVGLGGQTITVSHSQFVNCIQGIFLTTSGCGSGSGSGVVAINANNVLMANVKYAFTFPTGFSGASCSLLNCTFDQTTQLLNGGAVGVASYNSVYANITSLGGALSGGYNGFYNSALFGASQFVVTNSPFQRVGAGYYYLTTASGFRGKGTTVSQSLTSDLNKRTTYPPTVVANAIINSPQTYSVQAPRNTGTLDLGVHYDPIDYALGWMMVTNTVITVSPGTVIGCFGTNAGNYGLAIGQGATLQSQGTPTSPNWFVQYNTAQEQPVTNWFRTSGGLISSEFLGQSPGSIINCRFSDFSVPALDAPVIYSPTNQGPLNFRDCEFHGGKLLTVLPTLNFTNCLLERVYADLEPKDHLTNYVRNCLIYGGNFTFAPSNSVVQDNLFDKATITNWNGYGGGFNAYISNFNRLQPTQGSDILLTSSPSYQSGPLGNYYQLSNSVLINADTAVTANQVGLYHYTVLTNIVSGLEIKETNSLVDVGYHYVALSTNGLPVNTSGNGPDYLLDSNGDGLDEPGEIPWDVPLSIISQPSSLTVSDGSNAVFTVTAIGAAPLSWQWRFNGNNITGATASSYTIADVQAYNAGNYIVVVTNAYGSVTSSVAVLTRTAHAPVFVVEPIPQTVVEGDTVTFSALAIGTEPISYQWQEYDPLSSTYTNLTGQTSQHFVDVKMQSGDAGIYAILVSNSVGTALCTNGILTDAGNISSTVMPVFGPRQDYTFQAYTTYYIGFSYYGYYGTNVDLYGTTTIQGGAVIKFDYDEGAPYSSLVLHGPLVCQTGPYNPAILTSVDDDSQGEAPLVWWAYYNDISSSSPFPVATGGAFLNLDDVHDTNPTSLNYLRFCYADQAVTTPTNTAGLDIWNCQYVQCNTALNSWAPNGPTTNRLHNVLFSLCGTVFAAQTNLAELDGEQVTADVGSFWNPELAPGKVCLTNSIVLGNFGRGPVQLTQNVSINPENPPFEAGNSGNYYLARGSACRHSGTTNINPQLLTAMHQKTTEAPMSLAGYDWITNYVDAGGDYCFYPASLGIQEMTLFPVVQRYNGGAPDLGYYYDALDYTVAAISVTNRVTVLPGTAIGFRNDFLAGFFLQGGSAFVAQGTPTNPVVMTDIEFVQEGPLQLGFVYQSYPPWWWMSPFYYFGGIDFFCANAGTNSTSSAPTLNLRFCNLYLTPDDFSLWSGSLGDLEGFGLSPATSVRWSMRDCDQHGGQIVVGQPLDGTQPNFVYAPGAVGWTNNLFDTVGIELDPSFRMDENAYLSPTNDGTVNVDLPLYAVNNLFKGGSLMLIPVPSSTGDWAFNNNLFDQVLFIQDTNQPVIAEYNGYWPDVFNSDLEGWLQSAGWSPPWQVVLELVNNNGNSGSTHDQILTSAPPYQNGPFGNYYMAVGTVLAGAGSTTANQLGLYHYTATTNQVPEGNSKVDIGLNYLVASNSANGWTPLDSDGDRILDYVEDANGNGVVDAGETDPTKAQTSPGINDAYNTVYTNIDLDGDGMVGAVESALGKNPLVFDNPLILHQVVTGQEPTIATFVVSNSTLTTVGQLVLMVDGLATVTNQPSQTLNGYPLLIWNTTAWAAGQRHYLQAHLTLNSSGISADGPLITFSQPIVFIQPADQTNGLGGTVTFTAATIGTGPYTYQWQFDGTNIAGATGSSLTLTNLTVANGGDYTVEVTDADGDPVTSTNALLVVQNSPLAITSQPLSQRVIEADVVTFAVSAVGTPPLSYQWQKFDDNPGSPTYNTWLDIPGATGAAFTMLNMQSGEAGTYRVVVSNASTNLASVPAVLTDMGYSPDMTTMPVMGSRQNYTFRRDHTYVIGSPHFTEPTLDLYGSTTIEGGTVIRFCNAANASLIVHGTLSCETRPYLPAIFTSVDDFSQGELLWAVSGGNIYFLGTGNPQMAHNRVAYLNLDDARDPGGTTLSYLRFCYADQAVTTPTNSANLQVWNCQFYDCNSCVNSRLQSGYSTNGLHNVLFGLCNYALAVKNPGAEVDVEQVTADVVSFWNPEFAPAKLGLTNSIVIGDFPGGPALLSESVAINPPESPFGPSGDANYYLSAGSPCRKAGTANINPALLSQLKHKTTWAPDAIAMGTVLSAPTILAPTVPRYSGGPPDLGYYYDALDLTVGGVLVSNQVTVLPGTAIGIRNDFIGAFFIAGGSSLLSEGNPTNLITYADVQLVQEGPFAPGCAYNWVPLESTNGYGGVVFFAPTFVSSSSATLTMDFSQVFLTADDSCVQAGTPPDQNSGVAISPSSSIYWTMRDSSVQGGYITLGKPVGGVSGTTHPGGSVVWANNLFQDVQVILQPSFTPQDGNTTGPNVDMQVQAWNNLFRQGSLGLKPITNSTGNWAFTDNLFDHEALFQDASQPLDYGYNAYYPLLLADEPGSSMLLPILPWSLASTPAAELSPTTTGDGTTDGLYEQTNKVAPLYQTGLFGSFYQDTSSSLRNAGSRTAAAAGLAAFTVLTNGNEEGAANVSIGLHYVAVDSYGVPYASGGLPDWWQLAYYGTVGINPSTPDANGDGYTALEKYQLGLAPNIFYSDPLIVQPPLDQQAYVGTTAAFSVLAGGTLPLSYQWYFNGNPIPGATSSSLVFASVQLTNRGQYWVTVTSTYGSGQTVTSPSAMLSVLSDFQLFIKPGPAVVPSANAVFAVSSVVSVGTSYQWYFNGTPIPGATTNSYVLTNAQPSNAGYYSASVNGSNPTNLLAYFGVLAVPPPPVANPDFFSVAQNTTGNSLDVLANDSVSIGPLTITNITAPLHGTASIGSGGRNIVYNSTLQPTYVGSDSFTYIVFDNIGVRSTNTVTVFISSDGNNVLNGGEVDVVLQTNVFSAYIDLSTNNWNPGTTITIYSPGTPSLGTVAVSGSAMTYSRNPTQFGSDAFTCTITDGQGHFAQAQIAVSQTNAANDQIPDQWKILYGLSLTANVTADDPDGDGLPNLAEFLLHTDPTTADNPLKINGLALPAVLSGTIILPLGISSNVDVDAAGLELYVDGDIADAMIEKLNGQYCAEWDTGSVQNGLHEVSVGINYREAEGIAGFVTIIGPAQAVSVFNAVTSDAISRQFTGILNINAAVNIQESYYRIDIYDRATGSHLKTLTGNVTGGSIQNQWDFQSEGTSVSGPLRCDFSLANSAAAMGGGAGGSGAGSGGSGNAPSGLGAPAASIEYTFQSHIYGDDYAVAFGYNNGPPACVTALYNQMLWHVVENLDTTVNFNLTYGFDCVDYNLVPGGPGQNVPYASAFQWITRVDEKVLKSALGAAGTSHFFWLGHGSPHMISPSPWAPFATYLSSGEIAKLLNNHGGWSRSLQPYRLVILNSCDSYSKAWANAFGILFSSSGSSWRVADYHRAGFDPGAFVAWYDSIPAPSTAAESTSLGGCLDVLHAEWMLGVPLNQCMKDYTSALIASGTPQNAVDFFGTPLVKKYRISGAIDLNTYTQ